MKFTQEEFNKLPKWAQCKVTVLEREVESLSKKLSDFNGETISNTVRRDCLEKFPLPNNSQIEFLTGENKTEKVTVYVRSNGFIDVNTDSRTGKRMVIIPQASNSFYISFVA